MDVNLLYLGNSPNSIIMKKKILNLNSNKILTNSSPLHLLKKDNVIIIKHFNEEIIKNIKLLKKNKNIIIYEPIDFKWQSGNINEYLKIMSIFKYVDKIILPSKYCVNLFSNYLDKSKLYHNYHEFDEQFKINYNLVNDSINYIGDISKSSFTILDFKKYNINHIKSSKNNNLLKNTYSPSIHIDYLIDKNIYYHLHTSTKLGTALNFKSVFICNRIPIYEELLGKNYKYFFKEDLSNLEQIIKKAKDTINDEVKYKEYNLKLNKVLDKLKPKNIYNNYCDIINT